MYVYVAICSILVYLVLLYLDEQRTRKNHLPPTSISMKFVFAFFAFILSIVGIHLLSGSFTLFGGGSDSMEGVLMQENAHLKNINQDVEVGLPTF
jgi:hypothetical protein